MNSQQLAVVSVLMIIILCLCGCEGFRYAATEAQKENAWLHREVCAAAADAAVGEDASEQLCGLTELAHEQSRAFVMDYGLPEVVPVMNDVMPILLQAKADSVRRPDVFKVADGVLELGIALAGLVGGVYGIRIVGYLRAVREKSRALKEIVDGNELFKQLWPEYTERFKDAQKKQSPQTRQIVATLKAE